MRVLGWQTLVRNESEGVFGMLWWDPCLRARCTIDRSRVADEGTEFEHKC